ncbi:hypothetical protein VT84_05220 [Gemmata sp. SH-PL17]|uniref:ArsR/SmtB family transcription factor n=1 Tax=Gemmata sp. SH-PL17 TaxID=1630693 RepID=UPI00078D6CBA|nr:metalloregulator ArsR/SmtB family transcription factor [Gemmata sp. SH-PL17]AMV23791.1 hypothetical protein VT84_05220 [Gemmata sp. SH-PL17]
MSRSNAQATPLTAWLAATADPTRMDLIRALAAGEKTVTQLAMETRAETVNVSHHLKIMKDAGAVTFEKDGRFVIYSLVEATVRGTTLELTHTSGAKVVLPLE